jgi:prefoldin alpha subunit
MTISQEKQEKLQQKYMEMQMLGQQMQSLQKQLQLTEQQALELNMAKQAIEDISNAKPGTEILVPVVAGVFAKGQLKDNRDFIVNVGANTAVPKSAEESKQLIQEQEEEIKNVQIQLNVEMQKLSQKAALLENELSELVK